MPLSIQLSPGFLAPEVTPDMVVAQQLYLDAANEMLVKGTARGAGFLGWLEPDRLMPADLRARIGSTAARLRAETDTMVVVGIGGSYLGARAVIEALDGSGVCYAGQTLSAHYLDALLRVLRGRRWCINVVSKSGTTTEPAVAFRVLREALEKQVGKEKARDLIVATTDPDPAKSALLRVARKEGYETFDVPPNVGGRFSVLSAVGILPIAYAGIDTDALVAGAAECARAFSVTDVMRNPATYYVAARNLLLRQGKTTELLAVWEPRLAMLAEWWKQLFGESEGKELSGLFPASVQYTTDLHSMGQYVQEGLRNLFETFIDVKSAGAAVTVPHDPDNADGLNFLSGTDIADVNRKAYEGTMLAHRDGGVPNQSIEVDALTASSLGALLYFFERAAGISGYLLRINPFDQPGVEAYKNNMFALMKKPGFESKSEAVLARVAAAANTKPIAFATSP